MRGGRRLHHSEHFLRVLRQCRGEEACRGFGGGGTGVVRELSRSGSGPPGAKAPAEREPCLCHKRVTPDATYAVKPAARRGSRGLRSLYAQVLCGRGTGGGSCR